MTDLSKLMAEIDAADADLKAALDDEIRASDVVTELAKVRHGHEIRSEALHRALILVQDDPASVSPGAAPAPVKPRAHRRNIGELVLDAITARLEVKPLLIDEATDYLFTAIGIRRSAIEKALAKLQRQRKLFVDGEHFSLTEQVGEPLPGILAPKDAA